MKLFPGIRAHKGGKIWFRVSIAVMMVLIVISVVLTQNPFLSNTLSAVFGGVRTVIDGDASAYQQYEADYNDKESVLEAANALNEEIEEEGIVLLKNEDALPIATPDSDDSITQRPKISVFGKNSVNLVYGGSGSGGGSTKGAPTIYDSLSDAGYDVNPTLKEFYESKESGSGRRESPSMGNILTGFPTGETPQNSYSEKVVESYDKYSDAALVVISRIGGEGFDLPRTMKMSESGEYTNGFTNADVWESEIPVTGARSTEDHYLQLDQNETDLLAAVCEQFENVVLVINSAAPMELGFLDDPEHYAYQENIKGALWIGDPGYCGIYALGRVLNGSVNPSGRLVDTYARDFTQDPTWENFGNNRSYMGNRYLVDGKMSSKYAYFTVGYEEGIYVGYRYYETRGAENVVGGEGEAWYKEHVVYPMGYGKSYTTYEWELNNRSALEGRDIQAGQKLSFEVEVSNTGDFAGKDTVQIYVTPPYQDGGLEKAHKVLIGFAKTDIINAGESDKITIEVDPYDFATYDESKNSYVLEEGSYQFYVSFNAHDQEDGTHKTVLEPVSLNVPAGGILYSQDPATGEALENRFSDADEQLDTVLSRSDWEGTWPSAPSEQDRDMTKEFMQQLTYEVKDEGTAWYTEEMPKTGQKGERQLYEYIGVDYDDESWEELLDQISIEEMITLVGVANFNTAALNSVGKPRTTDPDGPSGFTLFMGDPSVYDTCFYACESVIGATWNMQLAERMGQMVGNEGIIGDSEGRGSGTSYSGWYAPAVNIHRSPFGGRNWEYYSEDGFLSGKMAANVCAGARSKGLNTYIKHFALNDQETNRDSNGILTWATEQSMREIYFKPFEFAVKEGGTQAVMTSFNRIGTIWAGGNYNLLTGVLRDEWGFRGMVVTDYNMLSSYMGADQMIRAGGDLNLSQDGRPSGENTATQVNALRRAAKNVLYATANSNAMNGVGEGTAFHYALPYWQIALIAIDCLIVMILVLWGVSYSKKKHNID
ncbi:MAG: glycoside hydrolase family 3 N-terminal domain-containing protein [Eubacteriales bacterium]|nr:glycoside hydrolase family 3 N-terminal domain-containing protein [Eubacteriales bacterium]